MKLAVALLTVVIATGCGDDGGSSDAPKLRPGMVKVFSGRETLEVNDLDVDGDRIAVMRYIVPNNVAIELSEDAGKTWREIFVKNAITYDLDGDTHLIGVHLEAGKVFLLLSRGFDGILSTWGIFEIDPTTGYATERPLERSIVAAGPVFHQPDGKLRWVTGNGQTVWNEIDPAAGTWTGAEIACTGRACNVPWLTSPDNGQTFDGYNFAEANTDVCLFHMDWATKSSTSTCVHRPTWPGVNNNYGPLMEYMGTHRTSTGGRRRPRTSKRTRRRSCRRPP